MVINVGDDVTAVIYNGIRNQINALYGTGTGNRGYGQSGLTIPPNRTTSSLITGQDLKDLRIVMIDLAIHTGSTLILPSAAEFDVSDIVDAVDWDQLQIAGTLLDSQRLLIAAGETSFESKFTSVVRTANWAGTINEIVTVTFANANEARWFFNLGGRIRANHLHTSGGGSSQDSNWNTIFVGLGELFMDHSNAGHISGSGGTTAIGFYDLTTANQNFYSRIGTGAYSANDHRWRGLVNLAHPSARIITFQQRSQDDHVNSFSDNVTWNIQSVYGQRRSTNHYVAPNPTFAQTNAW